MARLSMWDSTMSYPREPRLSISVVAYCQAVVNVQ
jgi:hypothetical protein